MVIKRAKYIVNIENKKVNDLNIEDFRSLKAKLAYAAFSTVPDALMIVATLAQFTEKTCEVDEADVRKLLRERYEFIFSKQVLLEMKYIHIPRENIKVVVCVGALFAVYKEKSSQQGILLICAMYKMETRIYFTIARAKVNAFASLCLYRSYSQCLMCFM